MKKSKSRLTESDLKKVSARKLTEMEVMKMVREEREAAAKSPMKKASYCEGESGWVEDLGDGTCRIANLPFSDVPFGIDDVCELLLDDGGYRKVGKVLKIRYPKKAMVRYPEGNTKENTRVTYATLWGAFRAHGWKLEGGVPGLACLAHDGDLDPAEVVKRLGDGFSEVRIE